MKNNYLAKFAAVAALVGAAASAHAGITVASGDLILGFQDATNSIQFDIGSVSGLTALNGATTDLGAFNINTALSYTAVSGVVGYGSGWATNAGISWTVFGKDTSNFYASMGQPLPLSSLGSGAATVNSTLAVAGDTTAAQSSISTMINGMGLATPTAQLKAGGATTLASKFANSNSASVNAIDKAGVASGVGFGTFINPSLLNTTVTSTAVGTSGLLSGKTYSAVDLYSFTNTGATVSNTFLGTLALTNTGEMFFTSAVAIPEPSTYAALLGVATLGFVAIRRRKQAAQLVA
jgi:hypothetical protein